jgi:hypothetical protein
MAETKHPEHAPAHKEFDTGNAEGRMNWVFFEFWPIMIWVVVFLLMCGLPLTLSGMLHNPFSSSDVVWGGYGLMLFAEFAVALAIFILAPRFIMPYFLLISVYGLIAAEKGRAWQAGWISDGVHTWMISNIAILFLTYVVVGWFLVFQDDHHSSRKAL